MKFLIDNREVKPRFFLKKAIANLTYEEYCKLVETGYVCYHGKYIERHFEIRYSGGYRPYIIAYKDGDKLVSVNDYTYYAENEQKAIETFLDEEDFGSTKEIYAINICSVSREYFMSRKYNPKKKKENENRAN